MLNIAHPNSRLFSHLSVHRASERTLKSCSRTFLPSPNLDLWVMGLHSRGASLVWGQVFWVMAHNRLMLFDKSTDCCYDSSTRKANGLADLAHCSQKANKNEVFLRTILIAP